MQKKIIASKSPMSWVVDTVHSFINANIPSLLKYTRKLLFRTHYNMLERLLQLYLQPIVEKIEDIPDITEIYSRYNSSVKHYLFTVAQFPFYFVTQCIWCILKVYNNKHPSEKYNTRILIHALFLSFVMVFLTKEILRFYTKSMSPLMSRPYTLIIFLFIFYMIFFSPLEIIPSILNNFSQVLCFINAINQVRLLRLLLIKKGFNDMLFVTLFAPFSEKFLESALSFERLCLKQCRISMGTLFYTMIFILYYSKFRTPVVFDVGSYVLIVLYYFTDYISFIQNYVIRLEILEATPYFNRRLSLKQIFVMKITNFMTTLIIVLSIMSLLYFSYEHSGNLFMHIYDKIHKTEW